ncbi:MAG: PAS domain-containing protein [Bacteriovoracaceae bacterium]
MNLSLKGRIGASFIIANLIVLVLGFTVFYFLDSLNKEIESVTTKTNRVALLTDEIRITAVSILKYQRRILVNNASPDTVEKLIKLCEGFNSQLQALDSYYKEAEVKKIIAKMMGYVDSLKLVLSKASLFHRDNLGMASIGDLADKILEAFSEFQDIQYFQNEERNKRIKKVIGETKRNMMITLIITFLGTILLGLIVPGKISLPFKKINDAIRELQECNFDVSIYYNQDDEIGEMSREMNKMIHNIKVFEELRTDRISVENRKFDALANAVKKNIVVANAQGEFIYLNNQLFSLLQMQSDDIIGKNIEECKIHESIKEAFSLAIKRRSKIENAEVSLTRKKEVVEDGTLHVNEEQEEEVVFHGFANVMPIRGRNSGLDYYLMVMSSEIFA